MDENTNRRLYEYTMLREEIMSGIKQQNTLSTFSISLTITIISLSLTMKVVNPYLFLMPFLFLIPAATKISSLKTDIMTQSAYLAVRQENKDGIFWETALNRYRKFKSAQNSKIKIFIASCEYPICGLICFTLFIFFTFSNNLFEKSIFSILLAIFLIFVSIIAILYLFHLSNNYLNMDYKKIEEYKQIWIQLLNQD